ncbi:hypothetical protein E2320_010391, partial [Naja naja]
MQNLHLDLCGDLQIQMRSQQKPYTFSYLLLSFTKLY